MRIGSRCYEFITVLGTVHVFVSRPREYGVDFVKHDATIQDTSSVFVTYRVVGDAGNWFSYVLLRSDEDRANGEESKIVNLKSIRSCS